MLKLLILLSIFYSSLSYSAVWEDTESWSMEWEEKYAKWISGNDVNPRMFVSKTSKYFGIKADCADAAYALRAIFSMENSLPFKVHTPPSGNTDVYKSLHNRTEKFDEVSESSTKKLIAMINYLGTSIGTEHLTHRDTIPVKISSITPGMLFTYKIKGRNRKFIRHAYNIKNISPLGNFDVIYATQAIARDNLPMMRKTGFIFTHLPQGEWGFRRWKWPTHEGLTNSELPLELNYSREQYSLVKKHKKKFFRYVKDVLKKTDESPESLLMRKIYLLCNEAQERVKYVNQGYSYLRSINGRCMDYSEYDAYSTPARDDSLLSTIKTLKADYNDILERGLGAQVHVQLLDAVRAIFKGYRRGSNAEYNLNNLCRINYSPGKSINLYHVYYRLKKGLFSSHPNDLIPQRWGETKRKRTRCKKWY
ncbi:MAG: hypothetical protein KC493_17265 [Bacteriovoracaceae bacterium]|nr:hypothetical protein [Bacteriovoracaceae bacterium]